MRTPHIITTTALIALFVIGCSKSPSQQPQDQLQQAREREATNTASDLLTPQQLQERLQQKRDAEITNTVTDHASQQVQERLQQMRQREATNNTPSSTNQ